jgi:hypothetical protein
MQSKTCVGTKTNNISGIWWYFWFIKNDIKHGDSSVKLRLGRIILYHSEIVPLMNQGYRL